MGLTGTSSLSHPPLAVDGRLHTWVARLHAVHRVPQHGRDRAGIIHPCRSYVVTDSPT